MTNILKNDSASQNYKINQTLRKTIMVYLGRDDKWELTGVAMPAELKGYDVLRFRCHLSAILNSSRELTLKMDEQERYYAYIDIEIVCIKKDDE